MRVPREQVPIGGICVKKKVDVKLVVIFALSAVVGFWGTSWLLKPSKSEAVSKEVAAPQSVVKTTPKSVQKVRPDSSASPKTKLTYDTAAVMRSFQSRMVFSENFHAAYKDSAFTGRYQLVYPIGYPFSTLEESKFDSLLLSLIFKEGAPKEVNRKSIQAALDKMMRKDVDETYQYRKELMEEYGSHWLDEVCGCTAYFYAMPIGNTSRWISFQRIEDYRCGGNGGPVETYFTIVKGHRSGREPYVMDTTVFVPGFREKLYDMITDNAIFNEYARYDDDRVTREMVHKATVEEFKGNFQPILTLSGVQFLFFTWSLPFTSHADGQIPVIVPYNTIQEILTEKFKSDIGL